MRRPAKVIVPARTGSTPVIERSVVVFPTPLRPISATTSPGFTSRFTPRRIREPPMSVSTALSRSSGSERPTFNIEGSTPKGSVGVIIGSGASKAGG
jgi:hypothetical protein